MRPSHPHLDSATRCPRPRPSPRKLRAALRLLCAAGLLSGQLVLASPAQAVAGDLDPGFGTGGKVTTDFAGGPDEAFAVAVQPDGKLVAAGGTAGPGLGNFALARYNPDGTLDASFGTGGLVTTSFGEAGNVAFAVAVQADGKLVAAGVVDTTSGTESDFALARYNADGTLDPSFGTGGLVTTDFAATNDQAAALAVQADGKLVAAGFTDVFAGSDFALARYNPDGALDPSFGTGGKVTTDVGGSIDEAHALVVQGNGRLVVAGVADNSSVGSGFDFALTRYRSNGTLDPSFGMGGKVTTNIAGDDTARGLVMAADGRLVAAGFTRSAFTADFALAGYRSNGKLDRSFGTGGRVTTDFTGSAGFDRANALVAQADGKLVAAGFAIDPSTILSDFALARYSPNGALDPSFGTGGKVTTDFTGGDDDARGLGVQADGKLVAAGVTAVAGTCCDFALARYLAS
jgi:uncharacterized delta-60 repeat protein